MDDVDRDNYDKITTIIKDKLVIQNVSNANLLKPTGVVEAVKEKTGIDIGITNHTLLWKAFGIRPHKNSKIKFETNDKYCIYDEPHDDYLYTFEWVNLISRLLIEHGFSKDNIRKKCSTPLMIAEYL